MEFGTFSNVLDQKMTNEFICLSCHVFRDLYKFTPEKKIRTPTISPKFMRVVIIVSKNLPLIRDGHKWSRC